MYYKLNQSSKLFKELTNQSWWKLFTDDTDLYINIRKDNYINVYYYGGSVAKIKLHNDTVCAEIHEKYLGIANGHSYTTLNLKALNKAVIDEIKARIHKEYLSRKDDEHLAEKWIQGNIVQADKDSYIDTEFAYNRDVEIGRLRIDIIQLSDGVLNFIELKGIYNSELMTKDSILSPPHIIEQIERYANFISKYSQEIMEYYQELCDVRYILGIGKKVTIKSVNHKPLLHIANTYKKETSGRKNRILQIEELLSKHEIEYCICK